MPRIPRALKIFLLALIFIGAMAWSVMRARADDQGRQTTITVSYTEYEWWLLRWRDSEFLCSILVDHEGLPTPAEVLKSCGVNLQAQWLNTPPCKPILKGLSDTSSCEGLYLLPISYRPKEREIVVNLPPASVWVTLDGCSPQPPNNLCESLPALLLSGEEPLPNEYITSIEGTFNGQPFACEGASCRLPLSVTPTAGITVEFWANSSYGDRSPVFTAQVRVVESGVSLTPGGGGWFVDVLSTQWRGGPLASCSQTWEAFPPIGGLPTWLSSPAQSELLTSDEPYYYLAGRLIAQGIVNASTCPTGGLLPNGYANTCGLETSRPLLLEWQNQFDETIIQIAQATGVPAQLMKNLFAQESQFWPGVFRVPLEFGLGQITDKGADTVLLWNPSFFNQFCPLVLTQDACDKGYLKLLPNEQAILRGALALQARADCPECPAGIDLSNAHTSISLFANTLLASCEQVTQIIYNATKEKPGAVSTYEDLWRFTLANYHAGPGCLSYAIHSAWQANPTTLRWDEVATRFTEPCQGVIPYVEKITQ